MSFIATRWRNIKHWWHGTESKYGVSIDQYPKEKIVIGMGGSTKISAHVITSSPEVFIKWQKVESHGLHNIQTDSIKYSGSSCSMPTPELIIHDVDITDAGVYQLCVTTITGTIFGPKVLLNVFGDPVMSLPKEERNFLRYYLLCQKIATESVRLYFTRKVPEPTLAAHLNKHKSDLISSYWKCTNDQIDVLFPAAPEIAQSTNFDFSLLYKLIRNTITSVSTPKHGWGRYPLAMDIKEEDDIERIRHSRNQLAHNAKFELNDSDFNNLWTDLAQVIVRLSVGSLSVDVIKLSKQKLDQQYKNEKIKNLKVVIESMKDEINIMHQDVEECRERIKRIEDTHIPQNIRQTHLKMLKNWKKEDELYYDETRCYQATKKMIHSCSVVGLVGGPGCGKTATAKHIALTYEDKGWEVIPVVEFDKIVMYGNSKLKQLFILDDILGVFSVNMNLYYNLNSNKEGIMNVLGDESKLLFTCRKTVYNEAMKLKSFVLENIADFECEENKLNDKEKRNLLAKHCRLTGVPEDKYCELPSSASFFMFPLLCKMYSTTYQEYVSVDKFFANPVKCIIDELDNMERKSPQQYAALVLCVLSNNMLSFDNITVDEKDIKQAMFTTCSVNKGTSDKEIIDTILNMIGTYLTEKENYIACVHDAIFETIAFHYGRTNPGMILKYMNSNFISTKVIVCEVQRCGVSDDLSILIDEKFYAQLAERLYTDLQSFDVFDVFMNKSLRFLPFLKIFIKTLREKPYNELMSLICHEQVINIYYNVYQKTDKKNDEYEEQSRQELLKNVYRYARVPHNPRIISWIIYYGHADILTSIISLVKEHNDSTDIVFGSDIKEQTRLLTLGCYSGNDDIVNVILKYVKIECINRTSLGKTPNCEQATGEICAWNRHRLNTPLTLACLTGNLSVVKKFLIKNAYIDQCDDFGYFPLLTASMKGHEDVVEYLVLKGGNVQQCNASNQTCLHGASNNGHFNVVKYLVHHGANVNQCDIFNQSSLYLATKGGHTTIVQFLVKHGADVHQSCQFNYSALHKACQEGDISIVKCLVENGADVNKHGFSNRSPLSIACQGGHKAVVEFLIENGADVQKSSIWKSCSTLYNACEGGNKAVVEFLVDKGSDVNTCDSDGQSMVHVASARGHTAVVEFLVEKGVDVHKCSKKGQSPVYKACESGHKAVLEFLVERGANINHCDIDDQSPLYIASAEGHIAVVEFLVEKGAEVHKCSKKGQSPLFKSCEGAHIAVVEFLVENGANINHCDINNQSPLYTASARGHTSVVEFLVENGADVNQCDTDSISPLYRASAEGHMAVVQFLIEKGADVLQCCKNDKSPLYKACEGGYKAVVEFLVKNGANVVQYDTLKKSPLYIASKGRHKDVFEFRVENGADFQQHDEDKIYQAYKSYKREYTAVVEFLVKNGADINQCNAGYQSPLYKACEGGRIAVVKFLVKNGADVNQLDRSEQSSLYIACQGGHEAIVEFLVENGADIYQCNATYRSPFYKACEGGHIAVVKFLVKSGADVNQCDIFKMSPLYIASAGGHKAVVEFLEKNGAKVNNSRGNNQSTLSIAKGRGHKAVVEI